MALNREVWIDQVKEGFYPDDRFLQKATDYSQFVDHNRLRIVRHLSGSGRGRQVRLVRVLRKGGDESRRRYSHVRHGERPQRACDDRRFRQTVRSITDPRQGHRRDCQRIRLKGL